jgi:hypothetical protein
MENVDAKMIPMVLSWKKEHGSIYCIDIAGKEYFFRALSRSEYLTIFGMQGKSSCDIGDIVLSVCLLYPEFDEKEFDSKLAGDIDSLLQCIISTSGFAETDRLIEDIEKERSSLGTLENQIIILICKAFPHLKLSDINNFTYEDLMKHLAISEAILDVKLNIEKPAAHKEGPIDFDAENREVDPSLPRKNLKTPRG